MTSDVALLTTLVAGLGLALVMGFLATRVKLPALVGYLLAGVLVGPATPGFVANVELAQQLADIGVILLMFGVGLHLSVDELLSVRRIAVPGAVIQVAVATLIGYAVGLAWGWTSGAALVFGLALSIASTVVVLRALEDRGLLDSLSGSIAVGWLIVQDLLMVLVLVVLPGLAPVMGAAGTAPAAGALVMLLAASVGRAALFIVLMLVVGRRVIPWLLWQVAATGSRELFTLGVITIGLGIAYGAARLFGVSFALGAFFAGTVMGESALSHRAAEESLPFRDAFSVLFFVSVGVLFDPHVLLREPWRVLSVIAIIALANSVVAFGVIRAFRYPLNTALIVSGSLAQIGEFSFILAALGVSLGVLPGEGQALIVAGALISIAVNPLLLRAIEPAHRWILARSEGARLAERHEDPLAQLPVEIGPEDLTNHVVLIGYGRVGQRIARALRAERVPFVVAEWNRESVERLRSDGILAVSGDATEPDVLIQAHVARARILVIAVPDAPRARRMLDIARRLKPNIETVVRTHSDEEAELLRREKASRVFMGEHELARGMIADVLERLQQGSAPRDQATS
ncbi:MAG: Kef family K(+) transporter [Betaproteobacteria bacterium]|nr:MAG: Kef family K(+) transporter [Betaproteobacteria bacterium]